MVLHSAAITDGGAVLNRMLLTELANHAQVTLLTVGEVSGYGNVEAVTLTGRQGATRVDDARSVLRDAIRRADPKAIGLPANPYHFDAVIGSGWTSGREANLLRRTFYPAAITGNALHLDSRGLGTALDDTERGDLVAGIHRDVFQASDLVFAPGPKAARDARNLISEGCSAPAPAVHELVPGVTVASPERAPSRPGTVFELLMLCRAEDRNKGVLDVALAVRDLRRYGHAVRLTVRGTSPGRVTPFQASMDAQTGRPGLVRILPFSQDRALVNADIDAADALVVASEIEPYGLVAAECAARGTPFLVAPGNGNGFAELLAEPGGIAGSTGHRFVIEDGGSLSANGNRMGPDQPDTGPRHRVLAGAIAELIADHDRMVGHTGTLQRSLTAYTPAHMAGAFAEAVARVAAGTRVSTRQGPHGLLLAASGTQHPEPGTSEPTSAL